ncbi:hypothetical protein AMAG_16616 [Allomyces macrogynus ATCC 38327]|uniref:DNA polymerase delta subunit 4 n=1 Tax=Allomyces macrogynus (strain ATCC 38327) TaxID=578462 RepID=A0A0L0TBJ7_ALLM3|nr:hypothetical protein AMAG_16616 [Allomyces macrogynus ATCC 38327]|eukprot:KNE72122.1 hypothetical protein AMAG_16616 [Allomyces macrogynus ATCC 38327]
MKRAKSTSSAAAKPRAAPAANRGQRDLQHYFLRTASGPPHFRHNTPPAHHAAGGASTENHLPSPPETPNAKARANVVVESHDAARAAELDTIRHPHDRDTKSFVGPATRTASSAARDTPSDLDAAVALLQAHFIPPSRAKSTLAALHRFDLDLTYGPRVGVSRLTRWERAHRYHLAPPADIGAILRAATLVHERDPKNPIWNAVAARDVVESLSQGCAELLL